MSPTAYAHAAPAIEPNSINKDWNHFCGLVDCHESRMGDGKSLNDNEIKMHNRVRGIQGISGLA